MEDIEKLLQKQDKLIEKLSRIIFLIDITNQKLDKLNDLPKEIVEQYMQGR